MTDFGRSMLLRGLSIATVTLLVASSALADQRRDYMLDELGGPGQFLVVDYFGTGGQLGFEHRGQIYGKQNAYTLNLSSLWAYSVGQVTASASIRALFLQFGVMAGYRTVWRNLSFEPGDDGEYCKDCDRESRGDRDPILGSGPDTDHFPMAEASVSLFAPFNEWIVFNSTLAARYEGLRPRSYDWFFTNVHDDGVMTRSETLLFFKHRDLGGFAPYLQVMWLPRAGKHVAEVAWGFNAVARLGLLAEDDLVFLTFLIRPGDDDYGQHSYFSPVRALLIYRMTLPL
jgi:hypothetical protein